MILINKIRKWKKRRLLARLPHAPDILKSSVRVPDTVYVVAGGPNGKPHYHRIPKDGYVIALNKSVLNPEIHPTLWLLNTTTQDVLGWIKEASQTFEGICIFRRNGMKNLPPDVAEKPFFYFHPTGSIQRKTPPYRPKSLFTGGTISGLAIQLAAHLGAREIILCGVDMSGQTYWDGSVNDSPKHGETWSYTGALNQIIESLRQEYGLTIRSLSPTRLNIPVSGSDSAQ